MSSRDPLATRAAILDAARGLFETMGYHAVGMERVAKEAGVSRQAVYLHFDSKAALLTALHQRINELDVAPVMERVWAAPDAGAGLEAFVAATAAVVPKIAGIHRALDAASRVEPVAAATFEPPRRGRIDDCVQMARWLERDDLLVPGIRSRQAADILFTLASIPAYESLVLVCGWSPRRWTSWTLAMLRSALLVGG